MISMPLIGQYFLAVIMILHVARFVDAKSVSKYSVFQLNQLYSTQLNSVRTELKLTPLIFFLKRNLHRDVIDRL